jgi:hypothetical protein
MALLPEQLILLHCEKSKDQNQLTLQQLGESDLLDLQKASVFPPCAIREGA